MKTERIIEKKILATGSIKMLTMQQALRELGGNIYNHIAHHYLRTGTVIHTTEATYRIEQKNS